MVFKCLHGLAPWCLSELISVRRSSCNTRTAARNLLVIPLTHKKIFTDRSLSVAGPKLWNLLPDHLRDCNCLTVFKKNLKTYLFCRAFNLKLMFNCKYYCCTAPLNTVSRNERSTSGINLNLHATFAHWISIFRMQGWGRIFKSAWCVARMKEWTSFNIKYSTNLTRFMILQLY